jgi:hypothetical protein
MHLPLFYSLIGNNGKIIEIAYCCCLKVFLTFIEPLPALDIPSSKKQKPGHLAAGQG